MKSLSKKTLTKYSYRLDNFLKKYKEQSPFLKRSGDFIQLRYDNEIYSKLSCGNFDVAFYSNDNERVFLSQLAKTEEFGGKGTGYSIRVETQIIEYLRKQLFSIKFDEANTIPLKIGDIITQVYDIKNIPGTPKADFKFEGIESDIFLSHKKGTHARHFNQWSGLTQDPISEHEEVKSFIYNVKERYNEMPLATNAVSHIEDENLKKIAVYGNDFGSNTFGMNNVHAVLQGNVNLVANGAFYELVPHHVFYNGDKIDGEYEPVLSAMYKGDRNQYNVKGARFVIQPLESRKITEEI